MERIMVISSQIFRKKQTNFPEIDGNNGYVNTNKFSRNNGKNHEFSFYENRAKYLWKLNLAWQNLTPTEDSHFFKTTTLIKRLLRWYSTPLSHTRWYSTPLSHTNTQYHNKSHRQTDSNNQDTQYP